MDRCCAGRQRGSCGKGLTSGFDSRRTAGRSDTGPIIPSMADAARWVASVLLGIVIVVLVRSLFVELGLARFPATLVGILVAVSLIEPKSYLREWLRRRKRQGGPRRRERRNATSSVASNARSCRSDAATAGGDAAVGTGSLMASAPRAAAQRSQPHATEEDASTRDRRPCHSKARTALLSRRTRSGGRIRLA